jgi:hypothetical protein
MSAIRDALLIMSSRVTYSTETQKDAVEAEIVSYFSDPAPVEEPLAEPIPAAVSQQWGGNSGG